MPVVSGTYSSRPKSSGRFTWALSIFFIFVFGFAPDLPAQGHEKKMVHLINQLRADNGIKKLRLNRRLAACARRHSKDMSSRNYFSHISPEGKYPEDRALSANYDWSKIGEALVARQAAPHQAIKTIQGSPVHLKIVLNPHYCDIGVGRAFDPHSNYKYYWTLMLGRQTGAQGCVPRLPKANAP